MERLKFDEFDDEWYLKKKTNCAKNLAADS